MTQLWCKWLLIFQIYNNAGLPLTGPYCGRDIPTRKSFSTNKVRIEFLWGYGLQSVFGAYYLALSEDPGQDYMMAVGLTGQVSHPNAKAFLVTPFITVGDQGSCLEFSYFVRSQLEIKRTSQKETVVIASYNVDGGRAWHQARLSLKAGRYRILWETQSRSDHLNNSFLPYHLYHAAVDDIHIRQNKCPTIGTWLTITENMLFRKIIHGPQPLLWFTFNLSIHYKVWCNPLSITILQQCSGWISKRIINFTSHFIGRMVSYQCWCQHWSMFIKSTTHALKYFITNGTFSIKWIILYSANQNLFP